jgi:tetratricopeptide (TPR) repeat protein
MDAAPSSVSNASSFGSPFMIGQGLVQARISPASSAWSDRKPRRFFDNSIGTPAPSGAAGDNQSGRVFKADEGGVLGTAIPAATGSAMRHHEQQLQMHQQQNPPSPTRKGKAPMSAVRADHAIDEPPELMDGMDLAQLRSMTEEAIGRSPSLVTAAPSMAVFYASLLYAKTLLPKDAFLYAQALAKNREAKRCVRLLEQSGLITSRASDLRLEAVLLAAQALADLGEWQNGLNLLEDASSNQGDKWSAPLDDEDDMAWKFLSQSVPCPKNYVHPIARLCLYRGHAYSETGHPLRAALYWKRSLKIDPLCVEALDCLLGRSVVTSTQAYEVIMDLKFPSGIEWLRSLYLARVDLSPQPPESEVAADLTTKQHGDEETHISTNFLNGHDASSIEMMTPSFQRDGDLSVDNLLFGANHPDDHALPKSLHSVTETSNSVMQTNVDGAFDKLWTEHKLQKSSEVLAMAARRAYRRYDLKNALKYCQELASVDPLCQTAGFVYVATLVAQGHKRLLFRLAHDWVEASPKSARAWFAVGAYYYSCQRYHVAQRHFCRSTRLDPHCTEAWIAFGCSFAACDESDQALASFRAAQRLAPGEHSSLLYIGMEYLRTNHLVLAQHFLTAAYKASGGDPVCLNELGVLASQQRDYPTAIRWFLRAIQSASGDAGADVEECIATCQDPFWEPTLFNLGQAYRKTRKFEDAERCFERCLTLRPVRRRLVSMYISLFDHVTLFLLIF